MAYQFQNLNVLRMTKDMTAHSLVHDVIGAFETSNTLIANDIKHSVKLLKQFTQKFVTLGLSDGIFEHHSIPTQNQYRTRLNPSQESYPITKF